ncbi:hypothetical protein WICMUC_000129 [Wickerhamomyces mucosus]|uniref:Zn(2)-C6 fungal-type domain-containing protein n=1 Tax=Wickerhamomyces mucosus TaxID=1378264 RepID=A0A9P8TIG6_9ASCO|nr:hypothetical protein WICMUC_000129 [Wickerhamomyces mucosus]
MTEINSQSRGDYSNILKKRIQKACDSCRARKLKCDGGNPCQRCSKSSISCDYTHVEKKRKVHVPRESKGTVIKNLDERMSKLENLMTTLVNKLDPDSLAKLLTASNSIISPSDETVSRLEEDFEEDECDQDSNSQSTNDKTSSIVSPSPNAYAQCASEKSPASSKYFGSQSSLSILSANGLIWLAQKANDPSMLSQFKNLYVRTSKIHLYHISKWVEPISKSELKAIPPREIVQPYVDSFFNDFCQSMFIISEEEADSILETYYRDPSKLTNSESLMLNIILAIGVLYKMDSKSKSDFRELQELQETHLKNAIFYYHKLTIMSEGLNTIQAILLLILYSEFAAAPQHNYMLISTAVRYAQELGLHREESCIGIPEEEAFKRRRLWFHVYLFDKDCCLRSGKPPIIHDSDVSSLPFSTANLNISEQDFAILNNPNFDIHSSSKLRSLTLNGFPKMNDITKVVVCSSYCQFLGLVSKAYVELFSANALKDCSFEIIMEKIDSLNKEHENIILSLPFSIRPGSSNVNWELFPKDVQQDITFLHLHCYLHTMIINRMSFKRAWSNEDIISTNKERLSESIQNLQKQFMDKCLDASRSMLQIFTRMNPFENKFFNQTSFLFLSAFFTLFTGSLEYPNTVNLRNDIMLMKVATETFFDKLSLFSPRFSDRDIYNTISYFLRFFLRIAMKIYNNTQNDSFDISPLDHELSLYERVFRFSSSRDDSHENDQPSVQNKVPYDPVRHSIADSSPNNTSAKYTKSPAVSSLADSIGSIRSPNVMNYGSAESFPTISGPIPSPNTLNFVNQSGLGYNQQSMFEADFLNDLQMNSNSQSLPMMMNNDKNTANNNNNLLQNIFSIPNFYLNIDDFNTNLTQISQQNTGINGQQTASNNLANQQFGL